MILIRYILICVVVYLLMRSFIRFSNNDNPAARTDKPDKNSKPVNKRVSKEVGEYIDYEDVKK
jgi:hypothetical protein